MYLFSLYTFESSMLIQSLSEELSGSKLTNVIARTAFLHQPTFSPTTAHPSSIDTVWTNRVSSRSKKLQTLHTATCPRMEIRLYPTQRSLPLPPQLVKSSIAVQLCSLLELAEQMWPRSFRGDRRMRTKVPQHVAIAWRSSHFRVPMSVARSNSGR